MTTNEAKRTTVGTKVRFTPNAASLLCYSSRVPVPAKGEVGTVTTVPFGGGVRKSFLPGPGGGLLYVAWEKAGTRGVGAGDAERVTQ